MFQVVLRMIFLTQFYNNGLLQCTLWEIHNASQATAEWPPSTLWLWMAQGFAWGSGECSYPILCLRLSNARGLSLTTLHDVFLRFQHEISSTLPMTKTVAIQIAALELCSRIGEPFEDEASCGRAFNEYVSGVLKKGEVDCELKPCPSGHHDKIDQYIQKANIYQ